MAYSSSSLARYYQRQYQSVINRTHCKCPLPTKEQVSWTRTNPWQRFKAFPIYDKEKSCRLYIFLDLELPSQYYKYLLFHMHVGNVELRNLCMIDDMVLTNNNVSKMKEKLTLLKSKLKFYEKVKFWVIVVLVYISLKASMF
ncbi:hypothetical protein Tco_1458560 [Tanacetum coccineum]